jgi:maleylacetate reductase
VKSFTYDALPGRVVFGVGSLDRLPDELDLLAVSRVLLVADPSTGPVAESLRRRLGDRSVGVYSDVQQHVPVDAAANAVAAAMTAGADAVVTIGGGTTTGFGKAIALETGIVAIAIPTTYAGSEMTPIYGLTSDGEKRVGVDMRVLPKTVIYDPVLTVSLPPSVTGPSGVNAIAHCVEALYSKNANPITSLMAEEGIRALRSGIAGAVSDPSDLEARTEAMYGAYLAGAALAVVGMAIHHRICHVLGGTFGLGHGEVNAVILPQVVAFNQPAVPDVMGRIARAIGADDAADGVFDFVVSVGAPSSLEGLGMDEADLDRAAELIADPPASNPRSASVSDVRGILDNAFHGRRPVPAHVG